ncbi:CGNR zinc finger domain-containing protein [Brenneria tiliae]|uniref:ABATE domain-containing protein n=1 Tax=Brenneria tiliae TaxID=2914984 RepID=A0ABT0N128_9GAMM|nr:ABATE domain-containing protein [Brenneria tiliae]MCL2895796.1 ABATE domain-containing protein [Brenneria tiliae]
MSSLSHIHPGNGPVFLADHGALDFLNTVAQVEGQPYDFWQSDEDVKAWLVQSGLIAVPLSCAFIPGDLLREARQLRETIRRLVAQKKAGDSVNPEELNRYLALASSYKQLVVGEDRALHIAQIYASQTPAQLLGPVAELAASLISEKSFELVRECEHPECSLWFYDRTKAHRRRWCSMALCGNRAKVARFRRQQK